MLKREELSSINNIRKVRVVLEEIFDIDVLFNRTYLINSYFTIKNNKQLLDQE